jgi:hypothetical protein
MNILSYNYKTFAFLNMGICNSMMTHTNSESTESSSYNLAKHTMPDCEVLFMINMCNIDSFKKETFCYNIKELSPGRYLYKPNKLHGFVTSCKYTDILPHHYGIYNTNIITGGTPNGRYLYKYINKNNKIKYIMMGYTECNYWPWYDISIGLGHVKNLAAIYSF